MTLKKQTVSGIKWQVGASFLQKAIQVSGTVILARILGPADFGLFALAMVAIDALGLFRSMGFDSALIQRKDDIEKAANSAFFLIPILGIILYLILEILAPWIAKIFNNSQLVGITRALGIIFVVSSLGRVPAALMERNMLFKKVSMIEISSAIIFSGSAVILAMLKFGVWSLVYAYILRTINQNILTFILAKWRPKFQFDKTIALEMFHFGKFLFLGGVVWFLKMNLDNMLVGKLLGVTALGLYAIAFNIANFAADYFGGRIYRVTFPAYSKLQGDLHALRSATLKTLKYISVVTMPLGIGVFLLSKELLYFVYGQKWLGAVSVLRILAFAGIFNTLSTCLGAVFLAAGKPRYGLWVISLQVALFLAFIKPMTSLLGLNGVGLVVTLSGFIVFLITLVLTKKILFISSYQMYSSLKPSLVASSLMALGIVLMKYAFLQQMTGILFYYNFIILSLFSLTIYVLSLLGVERLLLKDIKEMAFNHLL